MLSVGAHEAPSSAQVTRVWPVGRKRKRAALRSASRAGRGRQLLGWGGLASRQGLGVRLGAGWRLARKKKKKIIIIIIIIYDNSN